MKESTKYRVGFGNRVGIFKNNYCKTLAYIKTLSDELKEDYPDLKDGDMEVIIYGGEKHRGFLGVEATVSVVDDNYSTHPNIWLKTFY